MTNYNERLDEVLDSGIENIQDGVTLALRAGQNIDYHTFDARVELKQAITSLIKELVAEAKPEKRTPDYYSDSIDLYSRQCAANSRNKAIDEFEQNLLKALEEV